MLFPTTRASLVLCLALIHSVWPQTTPNFTALYAIIFTSPPSLVNTATTTTTSAPAIEDGSDDGVGTGATCRTDVQMGGVFGTCMLKSQCTSSEPRQTGNCIGFLEVCCPTSSRGSLVETTTQSKVRTPSLNSRSQDGCGRRRPGGLSERISTQNKLEFAYFGEFPWMVGILINQVSDNGVWNGNTYQGGGTLIGPQAVLTAAHVVREALLKGTRLKVRAGESDTEKDEYYPYIESTVKTIHTHEQYNFRNFQNDIALLILENPIKDNQYIDYACLPKQGQEAPTAKKCFATGWGKDIYGPDGQLQHRLKRIELPIVPNDKCQEQLRGTRLGPFFRLHSSFICAGGESDVDTCEGDGGSPLVCPIPDVRFRYIQYGIVAWGIDCADNNPGGYVDVADFRDWIDGKMQAAGLDISTYNFS